MPAGITKSDYAGACLCGGVQWTSRESPRLQFNCYCVDCRKSTGAAFVPIMFFKTESVTLSGGLTRFSSHGGSGHPMDRGFCTRCASRCKGGADARVDLDPGRHSREYRHVQADGEHFRLTGPGLGRTARRPALVRASSASV